LFALSESLALGREIARGAGLELAPLEERSFEDGEFKLRPLVSVRDRTAIVVQSLAASPEAPIAQRFVRLLFLLAGLRDAGAARTVALVPYLAYARKDRRTQPRDPVLTRHVAQLLEAVRLDQLVALDVHNPAALDNAFRIHVDHLSALPMFAAHFAARPSAGDLVVASPDVGGIKRAQIFREQLGALLARELELVFVEKRRAQGVVSGGAIAGEVAGRHVVLIDDLCATGGTLIRAAEALRSAGARTVHAAVTHVPLPAGLEALLSAASIGGVVTTDSVGEVAQVPASRYPKLEVLPIGPLFGQAVARMLHGQPLTPLLQRWPAAEA
jgi:ribose-phosphate pyrophosphokinase